MTFDDRPEPAKRLEEARIARGFKEAKAAANFFGWKYDSYAQHENGTRGITRAAAQYAKAYRVSQGWLLTGEGEGPKGKAVSKNTLVQSFDPDATDADDFSSDASYSREHWAPAVDGALPEVDTKLGAGSGTVGQTINLPVGGGSVSGHPVIAEWLIPLQYLRNEAKASPNHTLVMEVIGDSMQPTYMPGDRVLVDLSQNSMMSDTVYAISDGQSEPQIKRLQRVPFSDPVEVRIISDNPNLERFTVELERLTIIGRIVGHIARK